MRKKLYVAGTDLSTFGVCITGSGTYGAPSKDITTYRVPGRPGLVIGASERLENISVKYPCFIYRDFDENMRALRSFLLSLTGYSRITDDYDTTHYRMGFFEAGIEPSVTPRNNAGEFDLVFNCKPQRWLLSGEIPVTKTNCGHLSTDCLTVTNPTRFESAPLVRVYLNDTGPYQGINFSGPDWQMRILIDFDESAGAEYWDIDCETMQVFCGSTNLNQYAEFRSSAFHVDAPKLVPGNNYISANGGTLPSVTVTPRWWEV